MFSKTYPLSRQCRDERGIETVETAAIIAVALAVLIAVMMAIGGQGGAVGSAFLDKLNQFMHGDQPVAVMTTSIAAPTTSLNTLTTPALGIPVAMASMSPSQAGLAQMPAAPILNAGWGDYGWATIIGAVFGVIGAAIVIGLAILAGATIGVVVIVVALIVAAVVGAVIGIIYVWRTGKFNFWHIAALSFLGGALVGFLALAWALGGFGAAFAAIRTGLTTVWGHVSTAVGGILKSSWRFLRNQYTRFVDILKVAGQWLKDQWFKLLDAGKAVINFAWKQILRLGRAIKALNTSLNGLAEKLLKYSLWIPVFFDLANRLIEELVKGSSVGVIIILLIGTFFASVAKRWPFWGIIAALAFSIGKGFLGRFKAVVEQWINDTWNAFSTWATNTWNSFVGWYNRQKQQPGWGWLP